MPGRSEPPRNLGDMLGAQTQPTRKRRSADVLKELDKLIKENEDTPWRREVKKAKNIAEIEKIFPGVEEDEKTISGMYEPALHHYPPDKLVTYPTREDIHYEFAIPPTAHHQAFGTSPNERPYRTIEHVFENDEETPNFGTDRDERDYIGFQQEGPSKYPIDSPEYWHDMDTRSHNPKVRSAANEFFRRRSTRLFDRDANRAAANILGTSRRGLNSGAGPVTNTRTAAELMAQGNPARAGGRSDGRHHFAGIASPPYSLGRLPRELNPRLRNVETDYTVFSYSTPIAWRTTQGHWEVPRVNYSRTTQRHQSAIRRALSNSYHSPLQEASYRVSDLRQQHLEQGIRLPSKNYELNIGFETFHPEPPSESTIHRIVEDHIQQVINPAIERYRRRPSVQRRQRQRNQPQLPLEGGNE